MVFITGVIIQVKLRGVMLKVLMSCEEGVYYFDLKYSDYKPTS